MDDIGSRMPCCIVFSTTSRWLSSTSRAPSVPTISIQVRREVRISRRQAPPGADHKGNAVVHGHHEVLRVGNVAAGRRLQRPVIDLRVHPHRLGRLEAPEDEVEVVGRLHRGRRELGPAGDFLAQAARDVAAHQGTDRLPDRAVGDRLLDVREFVIEALRVSDRELDAVLARRSRSTRRLRPARPPSASQGTRACRQAGTRAPSGSGGSRGWPRCNMRRSR